MLDKVKCLELLNDDENYCSIYNKECGMSVGDDYYSKGKIIDIMNASNNDSFHYIVGSIVKYFVVDINNETSMYVFVN